LTRQSALSSIPFPGCRSGRLGRPGLWEVLPWFTSDTMAVPKRKHTNARTGSRRAHDAKRPRQLMHCPVCSTAVPSHVVCPKCGHYMGRKVVEAES